VEDMKKIACLIASIILIFPSIASYAQSLSKSEKTGGCFITILEKSKRNIPITPEMINFAQKNNLIYKKIGSVITSQCKGLSGEANYACIKANLPADEFDFYVGAHSAATFLNGPQDKTRLPNIEVAGAYCVGLVN